ncbi:gamma-butyrobetaine hydroxylase-like domain-containing protein [Melioribacteraceae bacterium 4301-Me]|uniref:gamma-butyrobetaine hydroxylase-like domain-containing protein n=1 Tax=Pyranulibacter aquaticus TaxID=3163344 RepID=UPI00359AEFA6
MNTPKKVKLHKQDYLEVVWDNGKIHNFPLKFLRDESPDAGNKGETILWKHYELPKVESNKPGKYEIEKIEPVGNYAIQIRWKDGYDYGIYSWDLLYRLGEYLEVKGNLHQDFEHNH